MTNCPICNNNKLQEVLSTQDYFFSQEQFQILQCSNCGLRITNPIPPEDRIGKYYNSENYISHNSSARGFINRIYSLAQDFNFYLKFRAIKNHVPRGTWLDYGAGNGAFLKYLISKKINARGYEPSESARKKSTEILDISHYSSDQSKYACITMWHVLEHIHHMNDILSKHYDHLIDDGIMIIAVPNIDSYDSNYYKSYWAALDTPRHLWHFNQKSISILGSKHGFKLIDVRGMPLDSFYVSLLSEKYKNGSSIRALIIGLLSNLKARWKKHPYSSQIYVFKKIRAS